MGLETPERDALHVVLVQIAGRPTVVPFRDRSALNLAFKDISLATELAREYDVPMPMSTLAEQIAMQDMNRGWGDGDSSTAVLLRKEQSGVGVFAPHIDPARAGRFITTHPDDE